MQTVPEDETSSKGLSVPEGGGRNLEALISKSPTFRRSVLSVSPSQPRTSKYVDNATIPKVLRRSTTANFHETLALDFKNESQVGQDFMLTIYRSVLNSLF